MRPRREAVHSDRKAPPAVHIRSLLLHHQRLGRPLNLVLREAHRHLRRPLRPPAKVLSLLRCIRFPNRLPRLRLLPFRQRLRSRLKLRSRILFSEHESLRNRRFPLRAQRANPSPRSPPRRLKTRMFITPRAIARRTMADRLASGKVRRAGRARAVQRGDSNRKRAIPRRTIPRRMISIMRGFSRKRHRSEKPTCRRASVRVLKSDWGICRQDCSQIQPVHEI